MGQYHVCRGTTMQHASMRNTVVKRGDLLRLTQIDNLKSYVYIYYSITEQRTNTVSVL